MYQNYRDGNGFRRHRLYEGPTFFDKPSVTGTAFDWIFAGLVSLVLHGNAWGLITGYDGYGFPTGIEWIPAEHVWVENDQKQPFNPLRTKVFVYGREMRWTWLDGKPPELFHVRAFTLPGRLEGLSLLRAFALTIMGGQEAQRYGTDWYRTGGFPPGTFHNCVDTETEILTRDGWRRYDEVTPGTDVLTLNAGTGTAEWQPVKRMYVNPGRHRVTRLRTKSHSSVTTPDHRWPIVLKGMKTRKDGTAWRQDQAFRWTTTETMPAGGHVCAAAPGAAAEEAKWSDALAEVIGWFVTEGSVGGTGHVTISQSQVANPEYVARIRNALTRVFGPATEGTLDSKRGPEWNERRYARDARTVSRNGKEYHYSAERCSVTTFHLNTAAGRVLTAIAPDKVVSTRFLSELTQGQLELLIATQLAADGAMAASGKVPSFTQKDRRRADAFQVACALAGKSGVVAQEATGTWRMTVQASPWRKPKGRPEYIIEEVAETVWCPVTENKSWFARRDGTCYFTGNTEIEIDADQAAQIRAMLVASLRRREPLVYGRDWNYTPVTVPPSEAQFIDAMQLNATQIAAILNLPPDRLGGKKGDSLSYANQQDSMLQILEALRPWLVRLEHAFSDLLPRNRFVRFYTDALLKTDLATRVKIYETQRNIGLRTVDEIRELEDLLPFPGSVGNEPMPLQLMTALGQRAGALPKSMQDQVVFLMDHAADSLVKLQKDHPELVAPQGTPPAENPMHLAASMFTSYARSLSRDPARGWDDDTLFLRQLGDRALATVTPEYIGAWIPDAREHVMADP